MLKFGIAVLKGPREEVPMTRMELEGGSSLLHAAADALQCTALEAEEKIRRLEAFTGYDGAGKTQFALSDLHETISVMRDEGFRAVKLFLSVDPRPSSGAATVRCCCLNGFIGLLQAPRSSWTLQKL